MSERATVILRTSSYTVMAMLGTFLAVPIAQMFSLALVGAWEDRVLAVLGAATILGSAFMTMVIKLGPALRKLVPAVKDIRQALVEIRKELAGLDAKTDRNAVAITQMQANQDEMQAKHEADLTGMGEAILIHQGDMIDPVKDRGKPENPS